MNAYKQGYWEGVRGALRIFAPLVAVLGFGLLLAQDFFGGGFELVLTLTAALACGMVAVWIYGLRVAAIVAGEETQ